MAIIRFSPHQRALAAAEQELQQRLAEKTWIDLRIGKLRQDIQMLKQCPQDDSEIQPLPVLCLRVLSFAPGASVSVPKIKEGLALIGFQLDYRNPLAVLHTTLGRLEQANFVQAVSTPDGNRQFRITPAGMLYLQQAG